LAAYAVRRVIWMFFTLFIVSVITFAIAFLMPTDPARMVAGPNAPPSVVNDIHHELGLDRPFYIQYVNFLNRALHGDFGRSYRTQQEVLPAIMERFPYTAALAILGILIELSIGITTGIIVAVKRGVVEGFSNIFVLVGLALPQFWLGIILLYVFAYKFPIFPSGARAAS
jgi:peptide/nickel transport system permease protein